MSLEDYLKGKLVPPSPSEERAVIEKVEEQLQKAKQFLRVNQMDRNRLNMFIAKLRTQITRIYGKNVSVSEELMPIRDNINPKIANEKAAALTLQTENFIGHLKEAVNLSFAIRKSGKVFIGHGHSLLWRELKDFLHDRLGLSWDEFNREAVAGFTTFERISQMLSDAVFAFLIMTAEEEGIDKALHARENVVHEVGLFQGRLGPKRAIILLEEGCKEFSNIAGLSQIRFPKGHVSATFEEVRKVLEREGVI
jgi:predicted nucleotide-binding protein